MGWRYDLLLQHWAGIGAEAARTTVEGIKKVPGPLFPFLLPRQDKSAPSIPTSGQDHLLCDFSGGRLAQVVVLSAGYSLGQNTEKPRNLMVTVLVIDDEAPVRAVVRSALGSAGYEVMEASNGREGLALFRQRPPDLVIADIHMPELNGLDVIMELTREFLDVKVIAISGVPGYERLLDLAKLLGARQTLHKPFSIEELLSAVRYELAH